MSLDVIIIGGGVIGLSIARCLHRSGCRRIVVLERGACGRESSWAAGGMLGPQAETDRADQFFEVCSASRDLYPALSEELLDETGVDIELDRSGTMYLAFDEQDVAEITKRFTWQKAAGLAVEELSADDARRAEPFISPDVRGALYFGNDWQVENRFLLDALKRYANLNGIEIRENCTVDRLVVEGDKVVGAETDAGPIFAEHTVIATGAWTSLIKIGVADMPFRVEPVRGQMVVFRTAKQLFRRVIYSPRGYIVPRLDGRVLAGSTSERAGFDRSLTDSAAISIRDMASEIAPSTSTLATVDHWSGLRPFAMDGLPVIGGISGLDGLMVATAHYRNGILLAPFTADIVTASILNGVQSPYFATFGPERFRLRPVGAAK